MAKKNRTTMAASEAPDWTPSIHLDVKSLKELEDLKVGDKVTVILQGKVKSIEQREAYDSKVVTGTLGLSDYEVKITGPDEWAEMADEDDD